MKILVLGFLFWSGSAFASGLACSLTVGNHVALMNSAVMGSMTTYRAAALDYDVEMVVDGESYHLRAVTPEGSTVIAGGFLDWIPLGAERSLLSFPRDRGDVKCSRF